MNSTSNISYILHMKIEWVPKNITIGQPLWDVRSCFLQPRWDFQQKSIVSVQLVILMENTTLTIKFTAMLTRKHFYKEVFLIKFSMKNLKKIAIHCLDKENNFNIVNQNEHIPIKWACFYICLLLGEICLRLTLKYFN